MSKYAPHHSSNSTRANPSTICQKCLKTGHFTYQCKNARPYVSRPSRTQQLEKPSALAKLKDAGKPSVEVPEEFKKKSGTANKILEAKEKEREKEKKKDDKGKGKRARSTSSSESDSDSDSSSESDSDSASGSGSGSDSADDRRSRERSRKRRRSRSKSRSP